jgi:hypothetical protein
MLTLATHQPTQFHCIEFLARPVLVLSDWQVWCLLHELPPLNCLDPWLLQLNPHLVVQAGPSLNHLGPL